MSQFTQQNRSAAIGTQLPDDKLLLKKVRGVEVLSEPFEYHIEMLSEDPNIDLELLMGEAVTIRLDLEKSNRQRYFNGIVADARQIEPKGGLHGYVVRAVPWLWFLNKRGGCRIFQKKAVPDILELLFKEYGFEHYELRLSETYPELEYCVQYQESDFNFVSRLMEEVGIYYYFVHVNGKHTLILADSKAAHDPFPDYPELNYIGPAANTTRANDIIRWELQKKVTSGAFSVKDYNFAEPKKSLNPYYSNEFNHTHSNYEIYEYAGEYTEEGGPKPAGKIQLQDIAKIRLHALQARREVNRGHSDCRGIYCGSTFKMKGFYRDDQNRNYLVTGMNFTIELDDYVSASANEENAFTAQFECIEENVVFRPIRKTPKPVIQGPQTAVVTGPGGEEIYTDEFGRVKIHFHWDREGKFDEKSSCWVRVSQNWAGKQWGSFFLPRIGQEVIVEFLEGDPDRPIITGRVYNGDNNPPYPLPDEKTRSTIKTNSSTGGGGFNELRFEDKKGSEQIFIHGEKDKDERIKEVSREWVGKDKHLHVVQDSYSNVERDEHAIVSGNRNTHIKTDDSLTVDGDRKDKVKGKTSLDISGDLAIKVGGKTGLKTAMGLDVKGLKVVINADTQISLKVGGSFIDISPAAVAIKGPMVLINSGGAGGAASPAPPDAPEKAKEAEIADDSKAGKVEAVPQDPEMNPMNPAKLVESLAPAAKVLVQAAGNGTPFCEVCGDKKE